VLNADQKLDRNNYKPLYVQVSEIILDFVSNNHLEHGDMLPSENQLLAQFDVSRNTIRLAVDRLVKMGVAKKTRGHGTFYIKDNKSLSIEYRHAFEGSAQRVGLKVANKLINKETVSGHVKWIDGLGKTHWDETIWIRRLKMADTELLAIEERLLPGFVVKRYPKEEIEIKNIGFGLVDQYPDTRTTRFNYIFVTQPLSAEEAQLTKLLSGSCYLRRIGEYHNSLDERFMLSRLTIISDRINLRYEYTKLEENWIMRD
jgi:DNA-binding GntR family transcriptional regulator